MSWSVEGVKAEMAEGEMMNANATEGGDTKVKGLQGQSKRSGSKQRRTRDGTVGKRTSKANLGVPGDSGAWIYHPQSGQLCGHVLAYSSKMRQAYIAPMSVIFEDIRRELGAGVVGLPGGVGVSEAGGMTDELCGRGCERWRGWGGRCEEGES